VLAGWWDGGIVDNNTDSSLNLDTVSFTLSPLPLFLRQQQGKVCHPPAPAPPKHPFTPPPPN
jgi:hypothetical protein